MPTPSPVAGAPDFQHVEPGRRAWLYAVLGRAELARGNRGIAEQWLERGEQIADGLGLAHAEATVRFVQEFPEADARQLRQLCEKAAAERRADRPPKHYRELFHVLNGVIQEHLRRQS